MRDYDLSVDSQRKCLACKTEICDKTAPYCSINCQEAYELFIRLERRKLRERNGLFVPKIVEKVGGSFKRVFYGKTKTKKMKSKERKWHRLENTSEMSPNVRKIYLEMLEETRMNQK